MTAEKFIQRTKSQNSDEHKLVQHLSCSDFFNKYWDIVFEKLLQIQLGKLSRKNF